MPAPRKTSDRYRSMAHYFGALIRDLRDSYEIRVGEPLTIAQLAQRTGYSVSMIGQIERGESLPESGGRVQSLDNALHAKGQLRTLWPVVQRLGHRTFDELASATNRTIASYRENATSALPQEDDMERRHLFQLAGLGLLAQAPIFGTGEPLRQMLEHALGTPESSIVDDWEATCAGHMHAILSQPASTVRDTLLIDLATVQRLITRTSPDKASDLQRIAGWLSAMYANVLIRLGDQGSAHRWLATARHAADASGDVDMRVWVRGTEAVFTLYSPRPAETVLTLAQNAQSLAAKRVTPGLMRAVAAEAQALAVLGRQREARDRLHHLHELAGNTTPSEEFSWTDDAAWFTASWIHSYGGDTERAGEARDRALACTPRYQSTVNVRLHEAISVGKSGGHQEALTIATQVLSTLDPAYRTYIILRTARMVLDTIPPDKRHALPALADYRAAISAPVPA